MRDGADSIAMRAWVQAAGRGRGGGLDFERDCISLLEVLMDEKEGIVKGYYKPRTTLGSGFLSEEQGSQSCPSQVTHLETLSSVSRQPAFPTSAHEEIL